MNKGRLHRHKRPDFDNARDTRWYQVQQRGWRFLLKFSTVVYRRNAMTKGPDSQKDESLSQLNQNNPTISNHSIDFLEKESPIRGSMYYEIYENN